MKIRNGFVNNSSSSSFVVAFPKKPKTANDVLEYMFNGKEGGVGLEYYDEGLSYKQVADKVFMDIDLGNAVTGAFDKVIEAFSHRYHYYSNDEYGGQWSNVRDRYCGSDKKLMDKYRLAVIKDEAQEKENREKERKIVESSGLKEQGYVSEGFINPYTKKPFTKEEVSAYKVNSEALENFKKTNKKYLAFQKKSWATSRKKWDKQAEIRKEIATVDAQNFFDDNKGKYIFIVSYGDENGEGLMEHGNIFRNVPYVKISLH